MGVSFQTGATDTTRPMILFANEWTGTSADSGVIANASNENTYEFWTPASVPSSAFTDKSPTAFDVDVFCIAAHNLGDLGCSVTFAYHDGLAYVDLGTISPTDNRPVIYICQQQTTDRIRVTVNGPAVPSIGVVMAGKRLIVPSGILGDYAPIEWTEDVEILGGQTVSGQFLGQRIRRRGVSGRVNFANVARSWLEASGLPFVRHFNDGRAFFFAPNPALLPGQAAYCWRSERDRPIAPIMLTDRLVEMNMEFSAYVGS